MKAWQVDRVTEAGDMRLLDLPEPQPGPGEYVVRVRAAGVNFLDTLMVRGRYQRKPAPPFTPGIEVAGEIVAAGQGTPLAAGQRVCASVETGGFAELACVSAANARELPDDVDAETGTVLLGVNYPTAYYALHERGLLRAGEIVLVHAAAGGVGSAAVELALAAGCRVIATAGSADKRDSCLARGAHAALDPAAPDWIDQLRELTQGDGVDVVFDPVGGDAALQTMRGLAWHARYLVIGFADGTIPGLPANRLLLKEASAIGVLWGVASKRDQALVDRVGAALLALYRRGALEPLIGGRFPLADAPHALDLLARRATMGKLFLTQD